MILARRLLILSIAVLPGVVTAQTVTGRFSSSAYTWQKYDTLSSSQTIVRGFQTLLLDASQGDLSFHTSLYGAADFSQSVGNDGVVRASNLFLRWKNIGGAADINIGRIPIFAGVGNGAVDGALVKARGWDDRVWFTAYGGENVMPDLRAESFGNLDKKFLVGSQIITTFIPQARIGVSYVNRHILRDSYTAVRPDTAFNAVSVLVTPDSRAEQILGLDARFDHEDGHSAYCRFDYDLNSDHTLREQLGARYKASDCVAFTGDFIYRQPNVPYNSFFSVFPVSSISEYEGGVEYTFSRSYYMFARYAYVGYVDAVSRRISVGVNGSYGSISYSGSNGYAGILNSFYAQGMYPLLNRRVVPMIGLSYATYRISEDNLTNEKTFAGSFGAVVRPDPLISADAQLQWLHNKIASNDVRLLVKLNYWFAHNFNMVQRKETGE